MVKLLKKIGDEFLDGKNLLFNGLYMFLFLQNIFTIYNRAVYYQPREYYALGISVITLLFLIIKKEIKIKKDEILIYSFLLILIIGQIYSIDKFYGFRTIIGAVIFIITSYYFSKIRKKKNIFYHLVLIGLVQAVIGITQKIGIYYKLIPVKELTGRAKIIGTIGHVNQYSHFLSMIFISGLALFLYEINKRKKIYLFISEIIIFQAILFTQTRASFLAILIAFFALCIYARKLILRKSNKKVWIFNFSIIFTNNLEFY